MSDQKATFGDFGNILDAIAAAKNGVVEVLCINNIDSDGKKAPFRIGFSYFAASGDDENTYSVYDSESDALCRRATRMSDVDGMYSRFTFFKLKNHIPVPKLDKEETQEFKELESKSTDELIEVYKKAVVESQSIKIILAKRLEGVL